MRLFRCSGCLALLALAGACASGEARGGVGAAGLATAIDSTGDSVVARVAGAVPTTAIRHLVEELRIAPSADDTSLFTEIFDFEVDPAGRLWVFDQPTSSIFLFGPDGALIRHLGRQGAGPGEYKRASGMISLGDTGIALWDPSNARISFIDSAGVFRTSWPTPGGFSTSDGLVTDRSGALFLKRPVTAPREGEILGRMGLVRLKEGGAFADSLAPPDLPVPRDVYVATLVQGGNRNQSSTSSSFAPNYHWGWHPDGYFVVANGERYEVILARANAKPLVIRREADPVSIANEEREEEQARITYSLRQTDPNWSWSGPAIPHTKAPISSMLFSRDGRIWIRIPVASESIPAEDLPIRRDSMAPVIHFRTPTTYEVFSADGHFLGRVDFPPRTRLVEAAGDKVWAIVRDADGLPGVVRFRIEPVLR